MKRCPYCAEEIQDAAIVCRFCGRDLRATPGQKTPRIILTVGAVLLAVLGVAVLLGEIGVPSAVQPTLARPVAPASWKEAAAWSGRGIKETEAFTTHSREWRVRWKSDAGGVGAFLTIHVHNAATNELLSVVASHMGDGTDVSYVRTPPGRHYLSINSFNTAWTISVEDQR